jgi:LysM repeat protein
MPRMLRIVSIALLLIFAALLFAVIIGVALLGGCRPTQPPTTTVGPAVLPDETPPSGEESPTPEMTIVLTVDNDYIVAGQTTTIRWDVQNAQRVFVNDNEIGNHQGTIEVSPSETTTWILRAERDGESQMAQVTVTVEQPPEPSPTPVPETIPCPPDCPPIGPPTCPPTCPPSPACNITYVVQPGDTLFSIARQHGISVQAIIACNPLPNPHCILAGQALLLPSTPEGTTPPPACATVHVVQSGDTIYKIGQQYCVCMQYILAANNLPNPEYLTVGQEICIPTAQ